MFSAAHGAAAAAAGDADDARDADAAGPRGVPGGGPAASSKQTSLLRTAADLTGVTGVLQVPAPAPLSAASAANGPEPSPRGVNAPCTSTQHHVQADHMALVRWCRGPTQMKDEPCFWVPLPLCF